MAGISDVNLRSMTRTAGWTATAQASNTVYFDRQTIFNVILTGTWNSASILLQFDPLGGTDWTTHPDGTFTEDTAVTINNSSQGWSWRLISSGSITDVQGGGFQ